MPWVDAPPDKIQELPRSTHRVMGGTYKIAVESQGKNPDGTDSGKRYYLNHPWKMHKNGRVLKIHSQSAEDWEILLPALNRDELRLVALLISDIRPTEFKRLKPHHIHPATGMPESVDMLIPLTPAMLLVMSSHGTSYFSANLVRVSGAFC
jgi:hypothetical protein